MGHWGSHIFLTIGSQMAVRLSASHACCPLPPGRFLVLISVRGSVDPEAISQLAGLGQLKNIITSSGIEHATFWLVAQYLNQLHYCVPPNGICAKQKYNLILLHFSLTVTSFNSLSHTILLLSQRKCMFTEAWHVDTYKPIQKNQLLPVSKNWCRRT
jgi:hypothetical protein